MHALIIGGGIAGPLVALALQRAGLTSSVFEAQNRELSLNNGAWLTVAVNGLDALRTLGLHQQVMRAGFATPHIELVSGTGKPLGSVALGGALSDGTVTHSIKRSSLTRVLIEACEQRGIATHFNKRLARVEQIGEHVVAHFEDGSSERGDLLIGTDGLHSRVRQLIDPSAPRPRYLGQGNLGGFTMCPDVAIEPGQLRMIFGKRCFFGYTRSPSGELWWFANPPIKIEPTREQLRTLSQDAWREQLCALFADDAQPAADIIRATDQIIVAGNQYDLPTVPRWTQGRLVILGDAAHAVSPASGQGASMAAEDAIELARCLRDQATVADAFTQFERVRRPRVERVIAEGKKRGSTKLAGPIGRAFRDFMLPKFLAYEARKGSSMAWVYEHHIGWEHAAAEGPLTQTALR